MGKLVSYRGVIIFYCEETSKMTLTFEDKKDAEEQVLANSKF
jgi:hypothetical protein